MHLARGQTGHAGSLYQYDYGQRLSFHGVTLPVAYEVHFSHNEHGQSVTMIGDATGVDIPDEFLLSGENVHVWIYLHNSEDDGETEYHGIIGVQKRAQPTDEQPTPVQQSEIDQAISALASGVAQVESIADAIPQTIDDALAEAKASGEFDGKDGKDGEDGYTPIKGIDYFDGKDGRDGKDGADGYTPIKGVDYFDGEPGAKGDPGTPGHSPVLTSSKSGKTTTIYADGSQLAQILDGEDGQGADVIDDTSTALDKAWSAHKTDEEKSALLSAINAKYTKPETGIPASDLASGVIPSVPVQDVQIDGTTIVGTGGVASIPFATNNGAAGVAKYETWRGVAINSSGYAYLNTATSALAKSGNNDYRPIPTSLQHESVFYGLAKASGDTTQASSSNPVGTFTDSAKASILSMLGVRNYATLIADYTTTEDLADVVINTDVNGDTFKLDTLMVYVAFPSALGNDFIAANMIGKIINESSDNYTYSLPTIRLLNNVKTTLVYFCSIINGIPFALGKSSSGGNAQSPQWSSALTVWEYFKGFEVMQRSSSEQIIPAGTNIKIIGAKHFE